MAITNGKLDPVGRIEGHLGIEFDSDATPSHLPSPGPGTAFNNVEAHGTMYRGFENIMKDRQPQEGIQICQRI